MGTLQGRGGNEVHPEYSMSMPIPTTLVCQRLRRLRRYIGPGGAFVPPRADVSPPLQHYRASETRPAPTRQSATGVSQVQLNTTTRLYQASRRFGQAIQRNISQTGPHTGRLVSQ
jgi:hypothetical protein